MPGEKYFPPDQPTTWKYWEFRSDLSRKRMVDDPLRV